MIRDGIEWVLFDAVGTLIYPAPAVAEAYHSFASRYGSRLTESQIGERFRAAFRAEFGTCGATSESQEQERWRRVVAHVISDVPGREAAVFGDLWEHFAAAEHWQLFRDVPAALAALREQGYKLGVASNLDRRMRRIVAGHAPLAAMDAVFVSSEVGYSKPHPAFFRRVEEELGVPSSAIALIGDDLENDYRGALAAGWQSIWLCRSLDEGGTVDFIRSLNEVR